MLGPEQKLHVFCVLMVGLKGKTALVWTDSADGILFSAPQMFDDAEYVVGMCCKALWVGRLEGLGAFSNKCALPASNFERKADDIATKIASSQFS